MLHSNSIRKNLDRWEALRDAKPKAEWQDMFRLQRWQAELDMYALQLRQLTLFADNLTEYDIKQLNQEFSSKLDNYSKQVTLDILKHGSFCKPSSKSSTQP